VKTGITICRNFCKDDCVAGSHQLVFRKIILTIFLLMKLDTQWSQSCWLQWKIFWWVRNFERKKFIILSIFFWLCPCLLLILTFSCLLQLISPKRTFKMARKQSAISVLFCSRPNTVFRPACHCLWLRRSKMRLDRIRTGAIIAWSSDSSLGLRFQSTVYSIHTFGYVEQVFPVNRQ